MGRWGTPTYVNCPYVSLGHSANCAYGCFILVQFYALKLSHLYSHAFILLLTFALQQMLYQIFPLQNPPSIFTALTK